MWWFLLFGELMPDKHPVDVSKQVKPIALQRPMARTVRVRRGSLTSAQMRRLSQEGIPGICKNTLIDQAAAGINWEITAPDGGVDATTVYYTMLLKNANDGEGAGPFIMRYADDILATLQGGYFEIVTGKNDVPVAVYNVDSTTIYTNLNYPDIDSKHPWEQRFQDRSPVLFRRNELSHAYWHPTTNLEELKRNRTPIELAYYYICILSATDDWNLDLVSDSFPAGVLALAGATQEEASAFKDAWDFAIRGGSLHDLAVIYGIDLKQAQHIKFTRPPADMAFEITNHWYASLIAASFEMSILDISILTQVSTKAGAESQERISAEQGQRKLRKILQESFERWLLPEGYQFKWIIPKPEDEATQATSAERRARAVNYYVMAFGPEKGYEIAEQEGLIRGGGKAPLPVEHLKSHVQNMFAQADLRGYMSLADWELGRNMAAVDGGRILNNMPLPPVDLWGVELYEWAMQQYEHTLFAALEVWLAETEDDPELAAAIFYEYYKDALTRAATRAYVAGKQQDATEEEAADIAATALAVWEIAMIVSLVAENFDYFKRFARVLAEEGAEYTRAEWRTSLYAKYLRRFYLMGITNSADPYLDLIKIEHGTSENPCGECPPRWGTYTVEEYQDMNGPPPNWCEGFDNCTCIVSVLRGARVK